MESHGLRLLTSQLAEDLAWLEEHCRKHPGQAAQAGALRLAAALVRNCLGPFLDGQPSSPLHLAVVGGAGAGKSTVVNFLSGSMAAESNPQAGFTRHPIAYTNFSAPANWPAHAGFLGPLKRLQEPRPSSVDEDVYQIRRIQPDDAGANLLRDFVLWDCPDMTTWAASGYVSRLLEVAALADALVYVASDERYNDEVPTQFLHQLLRTGKPVIVCLMKMKEADAPGLLHHFLDEVAPRLASEPLACLAIPGLNAEEIRDPIQKAGRFRIPLLNQVAVLGHDAELARRHVVEGARSFLASTVEELLASVRQDVAALESWRGLVQSGQFDFDQRYRHEYLTSEKFQSFDDALVKLLELLELPGVGKIVSSTLWVVRTPYRLLRGIFNKALSRPEVPALPEKAVLESGLTAWLEMLRKESIRRSASHPLWEHLGKGFQSGLRDLAQERLHQSLRTFQMNLAGEVDKTARAIYEALERKPLLLNSLRTGSFALDVAAIAGALTIGHIGLHDIVLVPLLASLKQQIVEMLGRQYVEGQREQIRSRQQLLVTQYISSPMAEWLAQWPATGGSSFERLQLALRRIPTAVRELDAAVRERLEQPEVGNQRAEPQTQKL